MTKATVLRNPSRTVKSQVISLGVSIGRGIFQKYFTPTAFKKFDGDHKIDDIIEALFWEYPQALDVLEQKWPELESKLNQQNVTNILLWKSRVNFEDFIAQELGWTESEAYTMFQVFLKRMQQHENEEKERVFGIIESWDQLSEDDYMFVLELFAYDRCSFSEFQKLYKFIRNTQFEGHLIIASLGMMKNEKYKKWLAQLVQNKWSNQEKTALSWFM